MFKIILIILLICIAFESQSNTTYKCIDSNNITLFSDEPCDKKQNNTIKPLQTKPLATATNKVVNYLISTIFIIIFIYFIYLFIPKKKKLNKNVSGDYKEHIPSDKNKIQVGNHYLVWSLKLIQSLEWKRFELLCYLYFNEMGYKAVLSGNGADGGIDITLYNKIDNYTARDTIIQCKSWYSKVGVKSVRELYGVITSENVPNGIFITSSDFTKESYRFQNGNFLKLISGQKLLDLINKLPQDRKQVLINKVTTGDYTTPSCPACDQKLIKRETKKGKNVGQSFWGCVNYPQCNYIMKIINSTVNS